MTASNDKDTNSFRCNRCGLEEFVFAMDGKPLDEIFAANYLCHECEELVINMHAAADSQSFSTDPMPRILKDA